MEHVPYNVYTEAVIPGLILVALFVYCYVTRGDTT